MLEPLKPLAPNSTDPEEIATSFQQPLYNQAVRKAVVVWPEPYNFWHMRELYRHTRQYDPLGEETLAKLRDLSYAAEQTKDPKEKERKAGEFQDLALDHLGQPDVMLQALALARDNPMYGDSKFYEWVIQGIENTLFSDRTGRSMKDGYRLITFGDEALIFSRLRAKSVFSEVVSDGSDFYTIHLAEDLRTHKQFEIFMDTSHPMRRLKKQHVREEQGKRLDLRQ